MPDPTLPIVTFALSAAAVFSALTVGGLLYARDRDRFYLAFLFQIATYGLVILVSNIGTFGPRSRGVFLTVHLAAQAIDTLALGIYVTLLLQLPFRGLRRGAFILGASLTMLVALTGVWPFPWRLANWVQGAWLVFIDGMAALYVVVMAPLRWRQLGPGLRRRLLGLYFGVTAVELIVTAGNVLFWGYGSLDPLSLENFNLIAFCTGSLFLLGREGFRAPAASIPSDTTPKPLVGETRLSDREKEVVALVVQGRSNKDIAQELSLSSTTVRNHLSRIFPKLGVQSRFELISRYKSKE